MTILNTLKLTGNIDMSAHKIPEAVIMGMISSVTSIHSKHSEATQRQAELQALAMRFEAEADLIRDVIQAVIVKRVDAIQSGFIAILGMYKSQSDDYLAQREQYVRAKIAESDPVIAYSYSRYITDIDINLASIRRDANELYRQMNDALQAIGIDMPMNISPEMHQCLALKNR